MTEALRKRLLDLGSDKKPTFRYVRAAETNVAATFARIKRQQKEAAASKPTNVKPIRSAREK